MDLSSEIETLTGNSLEYGGKASPAVKEDDKLAEKADAAFKENRIQPEDGIVGELRRRGLRMSTIYSHHAGSPSAYRHKEMDEDFLFGAEVEGPKWKGQETHVFSHHRRKKKGAGQPEATEAPAEGTSTG